MTAPTERNWADDPVRVCRTLHVRCALCPRDIAPGDAYRDGGYACRAHVECVQQLRKERAS